MTADQDTADNRSPDSPTPRLRKSLSALRGGAVDAPTADPAPQPHETGGPEGPEPTRYGDWERKGRCIDF